MGAPPRILKSISPSVVLRLIWNLYNNTTIRQSAPSLDARFFISQRGRCVPDFWTLTPLLERTKMIRDSPHNCLICRFRLRDAVCTPTDITVLFRILIRGTVGDASLKFRKIPSNRSEILCRYYSSSPHFAARTMSVNAALCYFLWTLFGNLQSQCGATAERRTRIEKSCAVWFFFRQEN